MLELANAIKELGLVAILASTIIWLLWFLIKWLLGQITKDRDTANAMTVKFTDIMTEFSKVNAATALVLSDMRSNICADQTDSRSHHQLASTSFAYIKEEHANFEKRLEHIIERIDKIEISTRQ